MKVNALQMAALYLITGMMSLLFINENRKLGPIGIASFCFAVCIVSVLVWYKKHKAS